MSLCISASKPYEHYLCVDTAISFTFNGIVYRDVKGSDKKIIIIDNEAYFFSGDLELVTNLQERFKKQTDRSFEKLTQLAIQLFDQYSEDDDELAFSKYGFDKKGLAYCQFTNNHLNFKPTDRYYGHKNNSFVTYGKNMKKASELLDLKTVHITPEYFIPIYEALADEAVGGEVIVYHLTRTKWGMTEKIKLNEPDTINKLDIQRLKRHYGFYGHGDSAIPFVSMGEGDGVVVSAAGKNISGVAEMLKPSGSYQIIYRSSNYAHERRLLLKDEGIELSVESGDLILGHDVGSFIKLKSNGDIELKAQGRIFFNGQEFSFND
ncbi:hypothetical protein [Paenibacillus durus]|uniref:Uncharacterized protein n=1 Tax=Paenibacillus durus ATCC 35681 TaxID=1333534 RepID=A0A0F7F9W3_PAEDU|nr:hypothetical protein [Paenibacillus durus]AKG35257.1 hypothetical protein VK70_12280 [Paenibacillus durus ATCC 35681]